MEKTSERIATQVRERTRVQEVVADERELVVCLDHLLVLRERGGGGVVGGGRLVAVVAVCACVVGRVDVGIAFQGRRVGG